MLREISITVQGATERGALQMEGLLRRALTKGSEENSQPQALTFQVCGVPCSITYWQVFADVHAHLGC